MKENKKKIAAALKYNENTDIAPKLIAKGSELVAENIEKMAKDHDIPIYKDEKLSKQLHNLSLGQEITPELYDVVAEVLAFITKLDKDTRE